MASLIHLTDDHYVIDLRWWNFKTRSRLKVLDQEQAVRDWDQDCSLRSQDQVWFWGQDHGTNTTLLLSFLSWKIFFIFTGRCLNPQSPCVYSTDLYRIWSCCIAMYTVQTFVFKALQDRTDRRQCRAVIVSFNDWVQYKLRGELDFTVFFWYSAVHNSRSVTPISWQAAVDDEEQRPLLQDMKQPSMTGGRRQLTSKNSGHSCKTSSKQPLMGITSRENSRGGFPLPSSRFLLSSVLLLDSSIIDTSMHGSCQRQPCCHRAIMVVQERCCAFEL